ncbi:MAG: hypothetical protein ACRDNZ_12325, partial [Streptosporangiaceae bacterium]
MRDDDGQREVPLGRHGRRGQRYVLGGIFRSVAVQPAHRHSQAEEGDAAEHGQGDPGQRRVAGEQVDRPDDD